MRRRRPRPHGDGGELGERAFVARVDVLVGLEEHEASHRARERGREQLRLADVARGEDDRVAVVASRPRRRARLPSRPSPGPQAPEPQPPPPPSPSGSTNAELHVEVGRERRVRHHASHQPVDRRGLERELVGEVLAVRLDQIGLGEDLAVLRAQVREVGHDGAEGVVAELHALSMLARA